MSPLGLEKFRLSEPILTRIGLDGLVLCGNSVVTHVGEDMREVLTDCACLLSVLEVNSNTEKW